MKKPLKKVLLLNAPYALFALFATKIGLAMRLAPGSGIKGKAPHILDGLVAAFADLWPSLHPFDLLVGVAVACLIRLAVYMKGKNAKPSFGLAASARRLNNVTYRSPRSLSRFRPWNGSWA